MVIKEPSKKGKLSKSTVLNPRNWNIVDLCLCITLEIILLTYQNIICLCTSVVFVPISGNVKANDKRLKCTLNFIF